MSTKQTMSTKPVPRGSPSASRESAFLLETLHLKNLRENAKLYDGCSRMEMWDPISRCFIVQYLLPKSEGAARPAQSRRAGSKRGQPDSDKDSGLDEEDMEFMRSQFGLLSGGVTDVLEVKYSSSKRERGRGSTKTVSRSYSSSVQYSAIQDIQSAFKGKRQKLGGSLDGKRSKRS